MPRPKGVTDNGTSQDHGKPLAVPLDVAQVLGRPLHELERADVEPYIAGDGTPEWSLYELAKALGLVESRETKKARRRAGLRNGPRAEHGTAPTGCRGRALAGGWARGSWTPGPRAPGPRR
jgi:hypothetical protein